MSLMSDIIKYWSIKPPYKGAGQLGTREWSESVLKHRYTMVPYWKNFLDTDKVGGKKVFEIGVGAGSDALEFCKNGAYLTGVDITDTSVGLTRKRLSLYDLSADLSVYDGKTLKGFKSGYYDLVYSGGVLHHTPYMDDLLAEAWRLLRPGGKLKFMVYNKDSFLYWYSIVYLRQIRQHQRRISREDALSRYSEYREGCPYTRAYTMGEIKERLFQFSEIQVSMEYPVYDSLTERNIPLCRGFDYTPTGVSDLDKFMESYSVWHSTDYIPSLYNWHMLVEAYK